jgi:hypothetical protein
VTVSSLGTASTRTSDDHFPDEGEVLSLALPGARSRPLPYRSEIAPTCGMHDQQNRFGGGEGNLLNRSNLFRRR